MNGIFLFAFTSRLALGPTQPLSYVFRGLSPRGKAATTSADHSPQSSAKVKIACLKLDLH